MSAGGKGDRPRPTDREKFSSGWDLAFGEKCDRCGQKMGVKDHIHTCSPQVKGKPDGDVKHRPGG